MDKSNIKDRQKLVEALANVAEGSPPLDVVSALASLLGVSLFKCQISKMAFLQAFEVIWQECALKYENGKYKEK